MKSSRYLILVALALAVLLSLGISSGLQEGPLARAQGQAECTVTVQPGESIQTAIDAAADGDVICLAEGTWEENVKIEKSLTLQGVDQEKTIIKGQEEGYPVIWITTPEEVQTVSVKVERMEVTEAEGECADLGKGICTDGVLIQGPAQAEIFSSTISGNWSGIGLGGSARAVIFSSTISGNEGGIELVYSAQATITNSTISGNGGGIALWDSAWATITSSTVSKNGDGIELGGSAQAVISNSTISKNKWVGIDLMGSAQAKITSSTIFENGEEGIWLEDSAQAVISNSTISKNKWAGIDLMGSAQAAISNSTISENGEEGIRLWSFAQATIESNKIINNGGYGVALYQRPCYRTDSVFKGYVSGKQNTIHGNYTVCPSPELDFLMTEQGGEYHG